MSSRFRSSVNTAASSRLRWTASTAVCPGTIAESVFRLELWPGEEGRRLLLQAVS